MTDSNFDILESNRDKILDNAIVPDLLANLLVIGKRTDHVIQGWVALDESLQDLVALILGEIEYSLDIKKPDPIDYRLFNVLQTNKYELEEVIDQSIYDLIQMQPRIFLVVLHKSIDPQLFTLDSRLFDWIKQTPPYTYNN
jgi:hypothetical protein